MCDTAFFDDTLDMSPKAKLRRRLTVEWAEAQGGIRLAFLKLLFPRYWGEVPFIEPGAEAVAVGISSDSADCILCELAIAVAPALAAVPDTPLRFPSTVRHA